MYEAYTNYNKTIKTSGSKQIIVYQYIEKIKLDLAELCLKLVGRQNN